MPKIYWDLEMFPQHVLQAMVLKVDLLLGQDLRRNWPGTTLTKSNWRMGAVSCFRKELTVERVNSKI